MWAGPYPVSMVGLDDAVVNNSYPTRETLAFLGFLQAGVVLAAEPLLARWMQRPRAWTGVVLLNTRIMTLYLWHLTAMVSVIGVSLLLGGFGLGVEPLTPAWWADPAAVVAGARHGHARLRRAARPVRDAAARRLTAAADLAARCSSPCSPAAGWGSWRRWASSSADGVHWWWPLLVVGAVGLLRLPLTAHRQR